jgi:hypothetical protein
VRSELQYKGQVETAVFSVLNKVCRDAMEIGIAPDEMARALFNYARQAVADLDDPSIHMYIALDAEIIIE